MTKQWFGITLINLFIVATIGVLLRYAFVNEIPHFEYMNWLHAHSHLAMLGWAYPALFVLILSFFVPENIAQRSKYRRLYWLTQCSVWSMLVAFIVKGYWLGSILLLAVHVLLSYAFVVTVWRDIDSPRNNISVRFLKTALVFQIFSTLAVWALPVLTAMSLKGSEYYYMAIQFFLHFQFNGWFVFTILAFFFRVLERHHVRIDPLIAHWFYVLLVLSCLLTYALAVAWSNPYLIVFVINGAGVILQFMALILFGLLLRQTSGEFQRVFTSTLRVFIYMALFCFVMKILMQTALVIPAMAKVGYTIRSFVIGFMHLILLGVTTMGIFGFAFYNGMLSPRARRGALLAMLGFLLVEVLLFVQGILLWAAIGFMPWYYEALVVASVMIAAGVLWMRYRQTSHVSVAV